MSYLTAAETRAAIKQAVAHNRTAPVQPKAIVWMDFPDTEDDLFSGEPRLPRPNNNKRRKGLRLYQRIHGGF